MIYSVSKNHYFFCSVTKAKKWWYITKAIRKSAYSYNGDIIWNILLILLKKSVLYRRSSPPSSNETPLAVMDIRVVYNIYPVYYNVDFITSIICVQRVILSFWLVFACWQLCLFKRWQTVLNTNTCGLDPPACFSIETFFHFFHIIMSGDHVLHIGIYSLNHPIIYIV